MTPLKTTRSPFHFGASNGVLSALEPGPPDSVRAVDTGTLLGFGEVVASPDITEGGLVVPPMENDRRTQAFRKLVGVQPPDGSNIVIVSHKPNIMDAFGKDWFDIREGEASVFKPDGNGGYKFIVRIQANEWSKLAQESN